MSALSGPRGHGGPGQLPTLLCVRQPHSRASAGPTHSSGNRRDRIAAARLVVRAKRGAAAPGSASNTLHRRSRHARDNVKAGLATQRSRAIQIATSGARPALGGWSSVVISPGHRVLTKGGSQRRMPPTDPGDPQFSRAGLRLCRGSDQLCARIPSIRWRSHWCLAPPRSAPLLWRRTERPWPRLVANRLDSGLCVVAAVRASSQLDQQNSDIKEGGDSRNAKSS
jgi:hypothetical protein